MDPILSAEDDDDVQVITGTGISTSPGFGSSGMGTPISIPVTSNGSVGSINYPVANGHIVGQQAQFGTATIAARVPKNDVSFVIVPKTGPCLELSEQSMITPRKMINICKFLVMASQAHIMSGIKWSEVIENLDIRDQFVDGHATVGRYSNSGSTHYIYLID